MSADRIYISKRLQCPERPYMSTMSALGPQLDGEQIKTQF